jgi:hypothetical protein
MRIEINKVIDYGLNDAQTTKKDMIFRGIRFEM